jgi:hypothetical protein
MPDEGVWISRGGAVTRTGVSAVRLKASNVSDDTVPASNCTHAQHVEIVIAVSGRVDTVTAPVNGSVPRTGEIGGSGNVG